MIHSTIIGRATTRHILIMETIGSKAIIMAVMISKANNLSEAVKEWKRLP